MSRNLRAALCAASLFALAASAANAQTAPITTTTPAITSPSTATTGFVVPTACQAPAGDEDSDENHGEAVRACVAAVRQELADADEHHGLGEWVSAAARENGHGRREDADRGDDTSTPSGATTPSTSGATTAASTTSAATTLSPSAQPAPSRPFTSVSEHATGKHGDHGQTGSHAQAHGDGDGDS